MSESDGIEEAFDGQLRLLVTAASQVGERIARAREEAQRRAQAASEQEARELASRLAAEQRAARAELASVHRSQWWEQATPEQIGRTYQIARAWAEHEPEAVRAEVRMREELRMRYGVDVDRTGVDPESSELRFERVAATSPDADAQRARSASENAEAVRLMQMAERDEARAAEARAAAQYEPDPTDRAQAAVDADRHERAADAAVDEAGPLYDSVERRLTTASGLEEEGVERAVVDTRMRADVSQGKPATEAVRGGAIAKKSIAARKARRRAPQAQRAGLDR